MEKTGRIVAVCTSHIDGLPKFPRKEVKIAEYGFAGDYHCKPMRRSFTPPFLSKPNTDWHITIVGKEVLKEMNQRLGLALEAGSLAENILTEGLGDLSDVPAEASIFIGNVELRVTKQNQPCKNLGRYHSRLVKEIYGKRGLLCAVVSGIGTTILQSDPIVISWK
jgi:hypothetical protein